MMYSQDSKIADQDLTSSNTTDRNAGANYRTLFQIGSGGFATIWVALAQGIGGFSKLVVLKTLREEVGTQPGVAKMFLDEARLSARMNHPNIVQVHEVFRRNKTVVIVMEYVEGQTLSSILSRTRTTESKLSLEFGISILIKILGALEYAHRLCDFSGEPLGLIHRDVSPHNVMVTYDGQVKLLDFGIAKLTSAHLASADETRTGVIKGKLTYMAPEQFVGGVDHRVDVFAVGVMLWELAARRRYWGQLPETTIMRRLIAGELPHLSDSGPEIDSKLAKICEKALSHRAEERHASAAALQEDLERYLADRNLVASQASLGQFVSETCADARKSVRDAIRTHVAEIGLTLTGNYDVPLCDSAPPVPTPVEARPLPSRTLRSRSLVFAGVGTALTLLLFGLWHFGRAKPSPTDATPAPASIQAQANAQPTGTAPTSIRLRAHAQPVGAVWYLDENRLGTDPLDIRLPKDDAPHILRAEADGHAAFARAIHIEADMDVTAVLAPTASAPAQVAGASPPAARRVITPTRTVAGRGPAGPGVAPSAPIEPAPTLASATVKPKKDTGPVQYGDSLRHSGSGDYAQHRIETDFPGE